MEKKFTIDGLTDLKDPTSVSFKKYDITNQERTMSGNLVVDYIATKRTVDVSWDVLTDAEFNALMSLIKGKQHDNGFYTLRYIEPEAEQTAEVSDFYTEQVTYYPYFLTDGSVVWRDVAINFVEV